MYRAFCKAAVRSANKTLNDALGEMFVSTTFKGTFGTLNDARLNLIKQMNEAKSTYESMGCKLINCIEEEDHIVYLYRLEVNTNEYGGALDQIHIAEGVIITEEC